MRLRHLGSPEFTWHDLAVILQHSPLNSAFTRARRGDAAQYGSTDYLTVGVWNTLRQMSWQLAQDKKAKRPVDVVLPGMASKSGPQQLGDSMSIEEMDRRLAKYITQ